MKKVYTVLVAAMFAATSIAQSLVRENANGPFANSTLKYQPKIERPAGKPVNYVVPTASNRVDLPSHLRKAANESEIISEQPAGTLHDNLYGKGSGFMVFFGQLFEVEIDATVNRYVEGSNGEFYIQNPVSTISPNNWIKGQRIEGDTIKFDFPQKYVAQEMLDDFGNPIGYTEYFWLYRANMQETEKGFAMVPDEKSQTIKYVLRNDSLIRVDNRDDNVYLALFNEDEDWTGYADFYQTWNKMKEVASVPPASATNEQYQVDFLNPDGQEDARIINVAIDGNDLYLGGLTDSAPENWVKGKIDGNKVVFDGKIYMGPDKEKGYHTFFSALGSEKVWDEDYHQEVDSMFFEKQIVFDYDATAKTLKSGGKCGVNMGSTNVNTIYTYDEPQMKPWINTPGNPKDPELLQFRSYDRNYGYGALLMWLEKMSVDNNLLLEKDLYYNLYFDGELFTATPDDYVLFKENMTDFPYNFKDGYDFNHTGNVYNMFFYMSGFTKVGIQALYKCGDKVYKSNLVEYEVDDQDNFTPIETSIKGAEVDTNNSVTSVSFSDLSGRRVSNLTSGVYLKTTKMADGTQKTVKVVKK